MTAHPPNNYRAVLLGFALEIFSRRNASNKVERNNVRNRLHSFFLHARNHRLWEKGKLPVRKLF